MNAVEALGILRSELRIKVLEDLVATITDHRDLLETIAEGYESEYDHDQTHRMAESMAEPVVKALKTLDNLDAMCLAEFNGDEISGCTNLDELAQTADTENAKTRGK